MLSTRYYWLISRLLIQKSLILPTLLDEHIHGFQYKNFHTLEVQLRTVLVEKQFEPRIDMAVHQMKHQGMVYNLLCGTDHHTYSQIFKNQSYSIFQFRRIYFGSKSGDYRTFASILTYENRTKEVFHILVYKYDQFQDQRCSI